MTTLQTDSHYAAVLWALVEGNDIAAMVREFGNKIYFAHIRNIRRFKNGDFVETSHKTSEGSLDITEIVKAYHDIGYKYYVRPDHGRHIWDEKCHPGYGLYDRSLGIMYIFGLWDAFEKNIGIQKGAVWSGIKK